MKIWDFVIVFALVYLGSQVAFKYVFPSEQIASVPVVLSMQDSSLRLGITPVAVITNNGTSVENAGAGKWIQYQWCRVTGGDACSSYQHRVLGETLVIPDRCPRPVFDVFAVGTGNTLRDITSDQIVVPCKKIDPIKPGEKVTVNLAPWKQSLFASAGLYEIELPVKLGTGAVQQGSGAAITGGSENSQYREGIIARFEISTPGFFTKMFRAFITKPFLNALIFIASITPGHNLGVAILVLTIIVKLLLFIPTQHSLEGQKKMQLLQPKFEAIRRQYADDPQKMQAETMKIWKEHKVNPFQSCLPLVVQFPVLIGLFYVIREGVHLELAQHLVYPMYQNIDWTFGTNFLGFDLTKSYAWIFPPLLVILQFLQMKLTFHISDKKKAKELEKTTTAAVDTPQEVQQKMMIYLLPLMIGFFAIRYPSALSLYWGISTVFAIGQQLIVNREHIRA